MIEFLIAYLFIAQKFELGLKFKKEYVRKDWSVSWLDWVEIIERSKTQSWETLNDFFNEIYLNQDDVWMNYFFARGFAGLIPLEGYPRNGNWD